LVIARLQDGVAPETAGAELASLARALEAASLSNRGWSASLVPLQRQIVGETRGHLVVVLAAAGLLLAPGGPHVAILTLSFVRLRQRELAVRRALGASEGRLACQLLVLSMLLGILGVSAGLLTALPLLKLLLLLLPPEFPRAESIRLDAPLWLLSS